MELFIFLSVSLIFFLVAAKIVKKTKHGKLPPGPKPLPIIGNLHQLNGQLPHRILADLARKYGDLMHLQLGEVPTLVVSSAQVAKEVMNDHDIIFANRPALLSAFVIIYGCQDILFSPYGKYWRQMRKICTLELLSPSRVQTFRSIREDKVLNMMRSIFSQRRGSAVNLSEKVYSLTYAIIAEAAFGKRNKYHEKFLWVVEDVVKIVSGFSLVDLYPSIKILERITGIRSKLEKVHKQIDDILESILREHKDGRTESRPGNDEQVKEDLVDVLLNAQTSGEFGSSLTEDSIKAVIYDIFSAGGETSATTILWTLRELIRNPRVLQRAQDEVREVIGDGGNVGESQLDELKYLKAVIKESMRLHPAAPLFPRESSEPCNIKGYEIPAKTRVFINFWAIGRDPAHWTEPEKFDPDRFLHSEIDFKGKTFSFMPFGAGRRICPGISFALANMELILAQLLYHFDWKLPGRMTTQDLDMAEIFGATVGPKHDLNLVPTPYHLSALN